MKISKLKIFPAIFILALSIIVFGGERLVFGVLTFSFIAILWIFMLFDKPKKVDYKIIGPILLLFGFTSFAGGALLSLWGAFIPERFEFPFGNAKGVVRTKSGLVYVGLQSYNRVQIYDIKRKFSKSIYVNASGGMFRLSKDEKGLVNVYTARGKKHYVLDESNRIIVNEQYTGQLDDYVNTEQASLFSDENGNSYYISCGYLYPRVIYRDVYGTENILLSQPIYIWVFGSPLPAWLFGIIGIILCNKFDKRKKKQRV